MGKDDDANNNAATAIAAGASYMALFYSSTPD